MDLLLKYSERLRRLQPDTVETRSLPFLTQERRKRVDLYTAESQRLINWLKQLFPQILRWFDDPATPLVGDLLLRWPTLQQLQKASPKTLLHFLHQHNCRSEERIQQRLAEIRQATPAITDAALLATGTLCIQNSIRALAQMRIGIALLTARLPALIAAIPTGPSSSRSRELDRRWNPGSSRPSARSAIASIRPSAWPVFTGIAPVQESSGNSCWTHWRWACPKFIRQTFHEWAGCSIRTCHWARAYYDQQRAKGKGHHAALRALAYKWIRIFFRCWRDRVPYSEQRYLEGPAHPGGPAQA